MDELTPTYADSFMNDLVSFVADAKFQVLFENFFLTYAVEFDEKDEHKLRYFELYKGFQGLFERQLEDFCEAQHLTSAHADYETFVRLMKIMRPIALSKMSMNADGKSSKTKGNPSSTKHGDDSEKLSKTTGGDDAKGSFADRPSLQNNQHASDAKDSDAMSPSAKMASE